MIPPEIQSRCLQDEPIRLPMLDPETARSLLAAREAAHDAVTVSLDLGWSMLEVELLDEGVVLPNGTVTAWASIAEIAEESERCYALQEDGTPWPVGIFSEETGWYRSLIRLEGTPTTLVGGFTMHRIKGTDPLDDTREKINAIRPVVGRVLDTATGLGYTAIQAAETANYVVTVELDPAAIEIARYNPWSHALFERENICIIVADIAELIEELPDASFDRIIHDPPTISLAGELYSEDFYRQLHRVLARRGRLFHYIGDPDSRSGRRTTDGVIRRLQAAGFQRVRRAPRAFGVVAYR